MKGRDALAIDESPDELDRIQSASARESAIGNLERTAQQVSKIRGALARIQDGSFGVCMDCEVAIHPKRLAAVPWATLCIKCQEKEDHERAMRGGKIDMSEEVAA
jgi:DnaK suppressor protein